MDENEDVRLTIETARKNKNLACRCYCYELAIDYFLLLEPDCYELSSYCDSIPEFVEEENDCCLTKALGAVKVFVNRCEYAPQIAKGITRAIIDKLFSASNEIRDTGTEIIFDLIEWESGKAVLKELMAGALRYDGEKSEECVRAIRGALLDFGPQVIGVYKLINFLQELARNKQFLDDECFQLLVVIYNLLGPQVRFHFTNILEPDYLSAVEESYEERKHIPIYPSRFVHYSNDNSSSIGDSEEGLFAACRIIDPTHDSPIPTDHGDEQIGSGAQDAEEYGYWDIARGAYGERPVNQENKVSDRLQIFDEVPNFPMHYEVDDQNQRNQFRLNGDNNERSFEDFHNWNRSDSVPELFQYDVIPEREEQGCLRNRSNYEIRPVDVSGKGSETYRCSLQPTNPFEVIIQKLMDRHGTEDILDWVLSKSRTSPKTPLSENGKKKCREINPSRKWKSLEDLAEYKEKPHNIARRSISDISGRIRFTYSTTYQSSLFPKYDINMYEAENSNGKKVFPSLEKYISSNQLVKKVNANNKAETVLPFERITLNHGHELINRTREVKENASDLTVNNCIYQLRSRKTSLIRSFFQKIPFLSSKKKNGNNIPEDCKSFDKKFHHVFKGKRSQEDYNSQYSYLDYHQQKNYFHENAEDDISSKMENRGSHFDKNTDNRSVNVSLKRSDFPGGWQTYINQDQISVGFFSGPEGLQPSSSKAYRNGEGEEMTCCSENESDSETSPNLWSFCFLKKMRKSKKLIGDSRGTEKSGVNNKKNPVQRNVSVYPGSKVGRLAVEGTYKSTSKALWLNSAKLRSIVSKIQDELVKIEEQNECCPRGEELFSCISVEGRNEKAILTVPIQ